MKRTGIYFVCLLIILGFLYSVGFTQTAEPPGQATPNALTPLMHAKLEKSKAILEGLTMEDFEKIATNARGLKLLSMESGWNVIQTEEYAAQSSDFRRTADLIADAAAQKDTHRATLGYVAMTVRCVECHRYMRQHRELQIPGTSIPRP